MQIPAQLRQESYGFVKLRGHTKVPGEPKWQLNPYRYKEIEQWYSSGNNYGVMGGEGGIVILDTDTKRLSELAESELRKTFTVKTPRSGFHHYFHCPDIGRKVVLHIGKDHFGEIISAGSQVVGPGSVHPDTKTRYEVFRDIGIETISAEELLAPLTEYLDDKKLHESDGLDIMAVMTRDGVELKKISDQFTCAHPVHGSKTGGNLVVHPGRNVWKCFRCNSGGGTLLLIAVLEGIIDCADAHPGVLRGDLFKRTARIAQEKYGFKVEQPDNSDAMPSGLWNDEWSARLLAVQHADIIRNCDNLGGWHIWNNKFWEADSVHGITALAIKTVATFYKYLPNLDEDTQKAFLKHIRTSGNEARLKSMANVARSLPNISVRSDDFDADPYLLNCQNGVVDLRTGKLVPHSSDLLLTKLCNTDYAPAALCPQWLKFLQIIFKENQSLIAFIQKAMGYALTGDVSQQIFFILHGDGANGKSTFVETFYRILGGYAAITPTATLIAKRGNEIPNDVARLKGARFVISSELERSKLLDEALVKRFTSDEPITARFLRQEFFEFKPTGKIFLSTNYKPSIRGTDDGIWRRIRLIPFEHKFEGTGRIENFAEKFLWPELPGILAWAVQGFLLMQKEGMKPPDIVLNATNDYKTAEDGVGSFMDEFCELGPVYRASVLDLYDAFRQNSDLYMKKKEFNDYLEKHGYTKERSTSGEHKGRFYWKGIRLIGSQDSGGGRPF